MKFIKSVPMAIGGLSLGLAALGNLSLQSFANGGSTIRMICGILSAICLLLFLLKATCDAPHTREEMKTPIPLSVVPTVTMASMLLATYILPFVPPLGLIMWWAAFIIHVGIMLLFFKRFILKFDIKSVFPTWFIAFVGMVTASVTAPDIGVRTLGQVVWVIGFIFYFIAFILIVTRFKKARVFPEPAVPTIAIFTAPMSLCVVGYFQSFESRNPIIIYVMMAIVLASYIFVTVKMFTKLLRVKFYPTYAAFTFPYVISALAFRALNGFLSAQGITLLAPVVVISLWLAILVVAYVIIRYVMFFHFWSKF